MSENAFKPPLSSVPSRRSWIRSIFAVLLGLAGAAAIVFNGFDLYYRIFLESAIPWRLVPWRFAVWEIELRVITMLVGVVWIWIAVMIARGRGKLALLLAIVNSAIMAIHPEVNNALREEFAGDEYTVEIPDGHGGTEHATVRIG